MPDGIDPSISLQAGKPNEGVAAAGAGMTNALSLTGNWSEIQNRLNTNRQFQQTFAARQRLGQIFATAPDLESAIQKATSDPLASAWAGEAINQYRQAQIGAAQYYKLLQDMSKEGLTDVLSTLGPAIKNVDKADKLASARIQGLSPQVQGTVARMYASIKKAWLTDLPADQKDWSPKDHEDFQRYIGAAMLSSGAMTNESLQGILGPIKNVDTGGGTLVGREDALGSGSFDPQTFVSKTAPPTVAVEEFGQQGQKVPVPLGGGQPSVTQLGSRGNSLALEAPADSGRAAVSPGIEAQPAGGAAAKADPVLPTASEKRPPVTNQGHGLAAGEPERFADQGKAMAGYQDDLNELVTNQANLIKTVGEARDALAQARAGGGQDVYNKMAGFAQAMGAKQETVDKIAGGGLGSQQEFQKLMVNTTSAQIQQMLKGIGGSRLNQQEWTAFQESNPNPTTDPRAIEKIFNFWTKLYNQNFDEQQSYQKYLNANGDPYQWRPKWQRLAQDKGYVVPKLTSYYTAEKYHGAGTAFPNSDATGAGAGKKIPKTMLDEMKKRGLLEE